MKTTFTTIFATITLALQVHAYLSVPAEALNVRHLHLIQREDGKIVSRSFMNTFDLVERNETSGELSTRGCHTYNACGTAGGCAIMAGIRSCDGDKPKDAKKRLDEAAKQSGANGGKALEMIGKSMSRSPAGMVSGLIQTTAGELKDAKKKEKKDKGKKKRALELVERDEDGSLMLDRRDYEFVERDGELNLVQRGEYSTYDLVTRGEDDSIVVRACQVFNGDVSCQ